MSDPDEQPQEMDESDSSDDLDSPPALAVMLTLGLVVAVFTILFFTWRTVGIARAERATMADELFRTKTELYRARAGSIRLRQELAESDFTVVTLQNEVDAAQRFWGEDFTKAADPATGLYLGAGQLQRLTYTLKVCAIKADGYDRLKSVLAGAQ